MPEDTTAPGFVLETERLRIRPWSLSESDVQNAFSIYGDPEVARYLGGSLPLESLEAQHTSLEQVNRQYRERGGGFGFWAVEEKTSGQAVGAVILKPLPGHPEVEVGWHLGRRAWGRGYATEAAREVLRYAFERLKLERVVAVVNPENTRSLAVARRLNMVHAGRIRAYDMELELFVLEAREPHC